MSIDKATVARVANLARIKVPEENLEPIAADLSKLLDWVAQLSEVATDGVEPMGSAVRYPLPLRADIVTDGGDAAAILRNAPAAAHGFFTVPKVVE